MYILCVYIYIYIYILGPGSSSMLASSVLAGLAGLALGIITSGGLDSIT